MGYEMMAGFFMGELSNPGNLMRVNFANLDMPKMSTYAGIYFVVTFIVMRAFFVPFYIYDIQFSEDARFAIKLSTGFLWLVSLYWIWLVTNLFAKQLAVLDPKNFNGFYNFMKSIRPYKKYYLAYSVFLSFKFILYQKIGWNHLLP